MRDRLRQLVVSGKQGNRPGGIVWMLLAIAIVALSCALLPVRAQAAPGGTSTDDRIEAMMKELQEMKRRQAEQQRQIEQQARLIARQAKALEAQKKQIVEAESEKAARTVEDTTPVSLPAPGKIEDRIEPAITTSSYGRPQGTAPAPVKSENFVTGGSKPGSFKMPGSNTSVRIGGYVKGDAIYNIDHDVGDFFSSSSIPVSGSPARVRKGSFRAHARQTRLKFETWTPTPLGEMATRVEADFVGAGGEEGFGNSSTLRLRHAYGRLGPLLVGQTWTLFMDLGTYPETVDFFGPTGIPFVRQGQVRYTMPLGEGTRFAISAENSEFIGHADGSVGADGIAANATIGSETYGLKFGIDVAPDIVAALEHKGERGAVRVAGLLRFFDTDTLDIPEDMAIGWGVHLSGRLNIFGGDKIAGGVSFGEGVGRYIINGFATDAQVNTETGRISPDTEWGVYASYRHVWSERWTTNLVYGHTEFPDAIGGRAALDTAHANLFFAPVPKARLGIEYIYGQRRDVGGAKGQANRVQFGAKWNF